MQGKAIVNSISLKEGEEDFLQKARSSCAATAPASSSWRSTRRARPTPSSARSRSASAPTAAHRAGRRSTRRHHLRPNILAIATGLEEHNDYAINFIEATRIDQGDAARACKISGGISNLSFSFRGNDVGARGDPLGVPVPRDQGRPRHGHRQRRPAGGLRGHPGRTARARRGRASSTGGPTRPSAWWSSPSR